MVTSPLPHLIRVDSEDETVSATFSPQNSRRTSTSLGSTLLDMDELYSLPSLSSDQVDSILRDQIKSKKKLSPDKVYYKAVKQIKVLENKVKKLEDSKMELLSQYLILHNKVADRQQSIANANANANAEKSQMPSSCSHYMKIMEQENESLKFACRKIEVQSSIELSEVMNRLALLQRDLSSRNDKIQNLEDMLSKHRKN